MANRIFKLNSQFRQFEKKHKLIRNFFHKSCKPNYLSFYAAQYSLSGELLSFGAIDVSQFQLCNYFTASYTSSSRISPFAATNYFQSCSIPVEKLLTLGASPTFYDIYLKYDNTSNLLPLPVLVSGSGSNLERRFFLVDGVSSLQQDSSSSSTSSSSSLPKYIRYAKTITIRFDLSSGKVNGQVFPPVFFITYDFVSTANLQSQVEVNFRITYSMDLTQENVIVAIVIGVLTLLSFFWSMFRTWIWNKRSGKVAPDFVTLFKFFMIWCSSLGNVLFLILLALSLYWLIIYKVRFLKNS